jgi:hypothetical protein
VGLPGIAGATLRWQSVRPCRDADEIAGRTLSQAFRCRRPQRTWSRPVASTRDFASGGYTPYVFRVRTSVPAECYSPGVDDDTGANRWPSQCDCRRQTEIEEIAPALRQIALQPDVTTGPSRCNNHYRTGTPNEADHVRRFGRQLSLAGHSPEAVSPQRGSNPNLKHANTCRPANPHQIGAP